MSVPPNLNPDNISLREMSTAERFMIMFGQPIPRCEWTREVGFMMDTLRSKCDFAAYSDDDDFTFCPNCGNRIKFITK